MHLTRGHITQKVSLLLISKGFFKDEGILSCFFTGSDRFTLLLTPNTVTLEYAVEYLENGCWDSGAICHPRNGLVSDHFYKIMLLTGWR